MQGCRRPAAACHGVTQCARAVWGDKVEAVRRRPPHRARVVVQCPSARLLVGVCSVLAPARFPQGMHSIWVTAWQMPWFCASTPYTRHDTKYRCYHTAVRIGLPVLLTWPLQAARWSRPTAATPAPLPRVRHTRRATCCWASRTCCGCCWGNSPRARRTRRRRWQGSQQREPMRGPRAAMRRAARSAARRGMRRRGLRLLMVLMVEGGQGKGEVGAWAAARTSCSRGGTRCSRCTCRGRGTCRRCVRRGCEVGAGVHGRGGAAAHVQARF